VALHDLPGPHRLDGRPQRSLRVCWRLSSKFLKPAGWDRFSLSLAVIGFALAYPAFSDPMQAIYLTFVPLYYPWPQIINTFTNTIIFAVLAPPIIQGIRRLPETLNTGEPKQRMVPA